MLPGIGQTYAKRIVDSRAVDGPFKSPRDLLDRKADVEATGRDPKEVRRILERSRQVTSLAGDIIRSKALDLLVESAEVMREGAPATQEPDPSVSQEDKT